jgi:uncharacterized protein (TIGR02453 family)
MLKPDLFRFLEALKKNNSREWFQDHRNEYHELRQHFIHYVSLLIHELNRMDPDTGLPEPKDCIFRINRDIRFSKDKSPYKTNMGAYISSGGKKSFLPGYYLHIEPGASMAAGGMYMPPSAELKKVRKEIADNSSEFRSIIESKSFRDTFGEMYGEQLKTAPQGYPKDHPDIDLLRYKSYTVVRNMTEEELTGADSLDHLIKIYRELLPLNKFLRSSLNINHQN